MFFVYGNDHFFIQEKVKAIIDQTKLSFVEYFYNSEDINEIVDKVINNSLFVDKKIYVFKNFYFFDKDKKENEKIIYKLKNSNHILIFTYLFEEDDAKTKLLKSDIFKVLADKNATFETKSLSEKDKNDFIESYSAKIGLVLTKTDVFRIEMMMPMNAQIIANELNKLKTLNLEITSEIIDSFVSDYSGDNIWGFINSFVIRDVQNIFKFYKSKMLAGVPLSWLVTQVSNKLYQSFIVYLNYKNYLRDVEIAQVLNLKPFQVKKIVQFYNSVGIEKVKRMLIWLAKLDSDVKKFIIDENIGFEFFLLQFSI